MKVSTIVISGALAVSLMLAPASTQAASGNNNLANVKQNNVQIELASKMKVQQQNCFTNGNMNWNENDINALIKQFEKQNGDKTAASAEQQAAPKTQQQPAAQVKQPAAPAAEAKAPQQSQKANAPTANQTADSKAVSAFEQKVVELTNAERTKAGLAPLKLDVALSKVAKDKSLDMKEKKYFSHTSPTYGSPFDMMKSYGISYKSAGENIAMGQRSPEEVVKAWMNSEGHRKNILSSTFTHIGVGHVESGNYWTQMFIGK
ncbi:CAP domain-containing protein [Jeotgalibacillus soli]|uniref:SCP domain-containing protein n=1 Tax=Jeotgalibacillus soli TaxID=889306 RepID=A0A0C2R1E0_9BACL|nr:CAP domain-containing protein [Jeotgalibacillus soli]KIL44115.1 hypothetical protein KP78_30790 [Jeotgalibacillus soli]